MNFTKPFKNLSKTDASIAGGKGASLGEMIQSGIPVPDGFVVLAQTFEKFIEETDINVEIDNILHEVKSDVIHTVEDASAQIQALIKNAKMPEDIASEILNEFNTLGAEYVAVRSSATAEDSASAAWAGQLDSFLNTTADDVLEKVQLCWASLFTPRAIFYRFEKDLHLQKISVAVVVQKMVNSEKSGIAFSVHPVTEDRNQLIIEAGLGLGEAIVSGQVTPDSYVVEKEPRRILDINVATQTRGLFRKERGGNEWKELGADGEKQVLTEADVLELSQIIMRIENHYGFPCDIEWAYENSTFYIVQSRPITTLASSEKADTKTNINILPDFSNTKIFFQFQAEGLHLLFADMLSKSYGPKGSLAFYIDKTYQECMPYTYLEQAHQAGVDLYSSKEKFDELKSRIKGSFNMAEQDFPTLIKDNLEKNDVKQFFELAKNIFDAYSWMDPLHTDEAFCQSKDNPTIKKQLDEISVIKDQYREKINTLFLDTNNYLNQLLNELSQRFNIDVSFLHFYTIEELLDLFENNRIDEHEITERQDAYILIGSLEGDQRYFGDKAKEIIKTITKQWEYMGQLSGTIAHKPTQAVITGKVRKIPIDYGNFDRIRAAMNEMEHGEILVAQSTAPELLPAMKKATAIVTDVGGLLSHAAIVSRELNIPCIVGTINATKILNTGDMVEVDANTGSITKISS